mgnify:CR=1 FL=1
MDSKTFTTGQKINTVRYTDNSDIYKTFTVEWYKYNGGNPYIKFNELKIKFRIYTRDNTIDFYAEKGGLILTITNKI